MGVDKDINAETEKVFVEDFANSTLIKSDVLETRPARFLRLMRLS